MAEASQPGPVQQEALAGLERGWRQVSLDQLGPDGTQVIGMVLYAICPLCSASVPIAEDNDFALEHTEWHLSQARLLDEMNEVVRRLLGA